MNLVKSVNIYYKILCRKIWIQILVEYGGKNNVLTKIRGQGAEMYLKLAVVYTLFTIVSKQGILLYWSKWKL